MQHLVNLETQLHLSRPASPGSEQQDYFILIWRCSAMKTEDKIINTNLSLEMQTCFMGKCTTIGDMFHQLAPMSSVATLLWEHTIRGWQRLEDLRQVFCSFNFEPTCAICMAAS